MATTRPTSYRSSVYPSLVCLPFNVRQHILRYTPLRRGTFLNPADHSIGDAVGTIRVNRQLYHDGMAVLYGENDILLDPQCSRTRAVLGGLSKNAWQAMRKIRILLYRDAEDFAVPFNEGPLWGREGANHVFFQTPKRLAEMSSRPDFSRLSFVELCNPAFHDRYRWTSPKEILAEVACHYQAFCHLLAKRIPPGKIDLSIHVRRGLIDEYTKIVDTGMLKAMLQHTGLLPQLRSLKIDMTPSNGRSMSLFNQVNKVAINDEFTQLFEGLRQRLVRSPASSLQQLCFEVMPQELQRMIVEAAVQPAVRNELIYDLAEPLNFYGISRPESRQCCGNCGRQIIDGTPTICYCPHSVHQQRRFSSTCTCEAVLRTIQVLLGTSRATRALAQSAFFSKAHSSIDGRLSKVQKLLDTSPIRSRMPHVRRLSLLIFGDAFEVSYEELKCAIRTVSNTSHPSKLRLIVFLMGGFVPQYESDYDDPTLFGKVGHGNLVSKLDAWYARRPSNARFASLTCAAIEAEERGPHNFYHVTTWGEGGERSDFRVGEGVPLDRWPDVEGSQQEIVRDMKELARRREHRLHWNSDVMMGFQERRSDYWL